MLRMGEDGKRPGKEKVGELNEDMRTRNEGGRMTEGSPLARGRLPFICRPKRGVGVKSHGGLVTMGRGVSRVPTERQPVTT